jgi:hypothetical protein
MGQCANLDKIKQVTAHHVRLSKYAHWPHFLTILLECAALKDTVAGRRAMRLRFEFNRDHRSRISCLSPPFPHPFVMNFLLTHFL